MSVGRLTVAAGVLFFVVLAPVAARADGEALAPAQAPAEPAATPVIAPPVAPPAQTHWYGWQTLVVDAASVSLGSLGAAIGLGKPVADVAFALGIGGYVAGVPAVHALHQRTGMGAASFGVRLGAPIVALFAVRAFDAKCHREYIDRADQCLPDLAAGLVVGLAVPMAIDALLFTWEPAPSTAPPTGATALRIAPFVQEHAQGFVLGGTF